MEEDSFSWYVKPLPAARDESIIFSRAFLRWEWNSSHLPKQQQGFQYKYILQQQPGTPALPWGEWGGRVAYSIASHSASRSPELLPHFQDGVARDDEHLRHVVCQHLAGIANVHGRLYQERTQELRRGPGRGQHGPDLTSHRAGVHRLSPPRWVLTLFVSSQNPNLDVGKCQESDGFRNSLLKLILNGRRT